MVKLKLQNVASVSSREAPRYEALPAMPLFTKTVMSAIRVLALRVSFMPRHISYFARRVAATRHSVVGTPSEDAQHNADILEVIFRCIAFRENLPQLICNF